MTPTQEQTAARLIVLAQNGDANAYAELLTLRGGARAARDLRASPRRVSRLDQYGVRHQSIVPVGHARHDGSAESRLVRRGLELFRNGQWVDQVRVDLSAHDAGTDSGRSYRSADQESIPRQPVGLLGYPATLTGTAPSFGTFTFTRRN
jgi:hypothetical protein